MSSPRFTGAVSKYPARFALAAYLSLIVVGALVLMLPISHADPARPFSPLEATFTSTSAVCVTGLSVRSIGQDLSRFGQGVLLVLIQLGGIGIITFTTLLSFGDQKLGGVRQRLAISEALGSRPDDDARWVVRTVIGSVLLIEGLGWLLLFMRNSVDMPTGDAAWHALFHSVSAYCNAGFGLYDDSLMRYRSDVLVNLTICTLIIVGGIGFPVMLDVYRGIRDRRRNWHEDLSVHSRLVLRGTLGLLIIGTAAFLFLERHNTLEGVPWPERLLAAFFHSTTCRTAGFNTVDIAGLTNAMLFVSILLMMIGASPCSAGGGFKVSSMMVLGLLSRDKLQGYNSVQFARRTLSEELIDRAISAVLLFTLIVGVGLTALLAIEQTGIPHSDSKGLFLDAMFEVVSALGTVGLSTGLTGELGDGGRWLLIVLMLIGRLGPISLFVAVSRIRRDQRLAYAKEDVLIG
ncbi:MAG: TrkH family potassium uptake protein [Planctomycetaceae bacterium]